MTDAARPAPGQAPVLVVGVGASAGGLEAFRELLAALPPQTGMAFILVQHLDPTHRSLLTELLRGSTTMPVVEAEHGLDIARDAVYVISPDSALGVREGALAVERPAARRGPRLPVDHLFRSLAQEFGAASAGLVLSGAGDDGADGVRAIKTAGGLTLAQDPATAGQAGMPEAAVASGDVDLVLPIAAMPEALLRFASLPRAARAPVSPEFEHEANDVTVRLPDEAVHELATILERHADFDVRVYKVATVQRRVFRRMTLSGHDTVEGYVGYIAEDHREQHALIRDLLISVTDFFRDPEGFEVLRTTALVPLVEAAQPGDVLRAWVAGCATGEEAYSIAIALLEAIAARRVRIGVQVFATDIDQDALAVARTGIYPPAILNQVPPTLLARYFVGVAGRGYQVVPALRDVVSFAAHDVAKDPPFSRMHLVTCRNLLIYLTPEAQEHVLRVLHFALQPDGCLFLGSSESTGSQRFLFSTLSKRWRVFRKAGPSRPLVTPRRGRTGAPAPGGIGADEPAPGAQRQVVSDLVRRLVMQARVPPTVVVGAQGAIAFMHGELRPYLRFPDGDARLEISELVAPDLSTRVRAALYRSRRDGETVVAYSSPHEGRPGRVKITATPAPALGDDAVILSFEEHPDQEPAPTIATENAATEAVLDQLEKELQATREDLRNTVEELESSNEELRSSHEETVSMNEELQAANEELEATTEELRSLNEELTTVNAQLREKVEQLEQANDDLGNFFESTKVATLFLGERLAITRVTPAAAELLRLDHADLGRFVADIARELLQEGLIADARDVLAQRAPLSRELHTRDMRWVLRRVLPYRTDRRIEGVVVTFTDVTDFKATAARLHVSEQQQAAVARLGLLALEIGDLETFFTEVVHDVRRTLRVDFTKILELQPSSESLLLRAGVGWAEGLVGTATVPNDPRSQAGFTLTAGTPVSVFDLAAERRFSAPRLLDDHGVRSGLSCVITAGDEPYGVIGVHSTTARRFTAEEANFLQAIAAVIAGAISRQATRVRLELEAAVATSLGQAHSIEDAILDVCRTAARSFGEGFGEYWVPNAAGQLERRVRLSLSDDSATAAPSAPVVPAVAALAARVFASGRAEWTTSVPERRQQYFDAPGEPPGLRTAIALPLAVPRGPVGVLVYLTRRRVHADQVLLRSLETIGRAMGDCSERLDVARRMRATIDGAPVGIADRALDGRWIRVNDRLCEITGYAREELLGRPFGEIVHPDDYERERELAEALQSGALERYSVEKRYLRKDGSLIWVLVGASLVTTASGAADYSVVVIEDISARKRAEDEVRLSESRFRDVLRGSPVPMMLYDERGRVLAVSDSWVSFTGYEHEAFPTAADWVRLAYRDRADEMLAIAADVWAQTPTPRRYEHQIWTRDDQLRIVQLSAMPLSPDADGVRLRVATMLDLTAQRAYQRELEEASQQKDEFIAMLSHELRNPLAAIRTAAEVLERAGDQPSTVAYAQQVLARQSGHMARLLDGLLDISRIVLGRIDLERAPVDLAALVRAVTSDADALVTNDGLTLEVEVGAQPVWLLGDAVRLTQALDNLLTNARKFTPSPGTIRVALAQVEGYAVVRVSDTGVGIAPELLPQVFEAFRQGAQRMDRPHGGLGLGLALVKVLVERQGGDVAARSEGPGHGAEFIVRLPLAGHAAPRRPDVTVARSVQPLRILLVEDGPDAAEMMRLLLVQMGHEVEVATHGAEAIERAREATPDVVLCDVGLPDGMSGYDVARALRAAPRTRALRLVALTGYGRPEDREQSAAAGFDAHLTKPVSADDLLKLLRDVVSP